jgi:serine/threonine protein kinase
MLCESRKRSSAAAFPEAKRLKINLPADVYPPDFSHIVTPAQQGEHGMLLNMVACPRIGGGRATDVYAAQAACVYEDQTVVVRTVAVKKFRDEEDGTTAETSFTEEADVFECLGHHAHIVQLLGVVKVSPDYMLVLEMCAGGTLDTALRHQPDLCQRTAPLWMWQLLSAVKYCHERGVLHGDIKPPNVLLRSLDCVVLADFGIAELRPVINKQPAQFRLKPGYLITTRHWRAPEVLLSQCYAQKVASGLSLHYGYHCDIWSLGVVFAQLFDTLRCVHSTYENDSEMMQLASVLSLFSAAELARWPEARPFLDEHEAAMRSVDAFCEASVEAGDLFAPHGSHARFRQRAEHDPSRVHLAKTPRMVQHPDKCVRLLRQMLAIMPADRPTADEAMMHEFFKQ